MALKEKILDRAQKYIQKGYLDKAIAEYKAAVDVDPRDISIRLRIGDLYVKTNKKAEAVKEYTEVAKANGQRGFYLKAIAVYKQILKLDDTNIDVHYKLAELYVKQRLIADAIGEYSFIMSTYERKGKPSEMMDILKKMSEIDPENIGVRLKLADLYLKLSFEKDAFGEYRLIFERLVAQGKADKAEKIYLGLYNSHPKEPEVLKGLSAIYKARHESVQFIKFAKPLLAFYAGCDDTENAAALCRDILDLKPGDADAMKFTDRLNAQEKPEPEKKAAAPVPQPPPEPEMPAPIELPEPAPEIKAQEPPAEIPVEEDIEITLEGFEEEAVEASPVEAETEKAEGPQGQEAEAEVSISEDGAGEEIKADDAGPGPSVAPDEPQMDAQAAPVEEEVEIDIGVTEPEPMQAQPLPDIEPDIDIEAEKEAAGGVAAEQAQDTGSEEIEVEAGIEEGPIVETADAGAGEADIEAASQAEAKEETADEDASGPALISVDSLGMGAEQAGAAEDITGKEKGAAAESDQADAAPVHEVRQEPPIEKKAEEEEDSRFTRLLHEAPAEPADIETAAAEEDGQEDLSSAIAELMEKIEPQELVESPEETKKEEYVDLTAELGMEEVLEDITGAWGGGTQPADTFDEFKNGVGKQLSKEDSETHYNLGIAYMEMELYGEAVKEFKIALKDPHLEFDCFIRLGHCAMAESNPQEAVLYYLKGLKIEDESDDERKGMMYELALAYEAAGEADSALEIFKTIHGKDPGYRETAEKLQELSSVRELPRIPVNDGLIEVELL